ncbi:MAG: sporulation protein YunB [Ruminococcaceae bacterium]|nr:sporulation protein YunB [Oscillospiraceae bacterium]
MRYRRFSARNNKIVFRLICIFLALLIGVLLTDAKLRPAIYDLAAVEARGRAVKIINTAVENILLKSGVAYADIVTISRNESGSITGITTDIVKMNLFKSRVTNAVDDAFLQNETVTVTVPLGSATGVAFLSGCGPHIDVKMHIDSSSQSDFSNIFESAGINQTQHSVMLSLETDVVLTMSGRRITQNIKTSFCIAQTVIVGTVPNVMVE